MDLEQQLIENLKDVEERQICKKVLESYKDIVLGKGRDCNEFFDELEKRLGGIV